MIDFSRFKIKDLINNKTIIVSISIIILALGATMYFIVNKQNDNAVIENFGSEKSNSNNENLNGSDSQENQNLEHKNDNTIMIHMIGEINNPGVISLEKGQRIVDAIEKAGGATEKADLTKINLAFVLSDGVRVKIPSIYDKENDVYVTQNSGNNIITEGTNFSLNKGGGKVNINTATQTELETLTGIGPSLANKILEYRNKNGKFKKVDELKNVKGIGQSKFDGIKDEIVVD